METNRSKTYSLSGIFKIISDPENNGVARGFAEKFPDDGKSIVVPGRMPSERISYDYSYSSVFPDYHGFVWYYKTFDGVLVAEGEHCLLEFERVGYLADVWLNGKHLGSHRHHEEAFSYDITDCMKADGENLLAVRVFEPMRDRDPIEGILLRDIPNGSLANHEGEGTPSNVIGGITGEVRLKIVPDLFVTDQWICADAKTGHVKVTVSLENAGPCAQDETVSLLISEMKTGLPVCEVSRRVTVPAGESETVLECDVEGFKLWELQNPFLYLSQVRVGTFSQVARFGFREIRLENGFFTLNGRRFLLKCAHGTFSASNCTAMKALGFNAFRSIHRTMDREVMDLCDELGFLIIESPITSWGMREHENTRSMVRDYMRNMVRMHRNHPSVCAYYFYNETDDRHLIEIAEELLPEIRALDPQNIFLLSSARWDNMPEVNSASNPGSVTFDVPLGGEGTTGVADNWLDGYHGYGLTSAPMGDIHAYAAYPLDGPTRNWFRTVGTQTRPVFISESGIGSQVNPVSWTLQAEALAPLRPGFPENCPFPEQKAAWVLGLPPRALWEETEAFLDFYGLRELYPFADLLCAEGDRLNGRQREQMFDLMRANSHLCGFSLTSFGGGNEGMCEGTALGNGIVKESVAHAVQHGLAPLRFSLFATDRIVYADRETELEAVLCNEDRLPAGRYPMLLCVDGGTPTHIVKTWTTEAAYPSEGPGGFPPLAATVFKDTVVLEEGEYVFRARLTQGDMPCGGDLKIRAVKIRDEAVRGKTICGIGLADATVAFLEKHGVCVLPAEAAKTVGVLLVGASLKEENGEWEQVLGPVNEGATVIFADERLFRTDPDRVKEIAGENAKETVYNDWLYHNDTIHVGHPVFADMTPAGFCDLESYGPTYPTAMFESTVKPAKTGSVSFRISGNFTSGVNFGEFAVGKGRAILNAFQICDNLEKHPFADRMLLNIVEVYGA